MSPPSQSTVWACTWSAPPSKLAWCACQFWSTAVPARYTSAPSTSRCEYRTRLVRDAARARPPGATVLAIAALARAHELLRPGGGRPRLAAQRAGPEGGARELPQRRLGPGLELGDAGLEGFAAADRRRRAEVDPGRPPHDLVERAREGALAVDAQRPAVGGELAPRDVAAAQ